MSSVDDNKSTFDEFGDGGGTVSTSSKKECTSCEQKVDEHIRAGASDNSDDTTGSNCNSDIGAVVEGISKVDISNDNKTGSSSNTVSTNCISQDDEKLFAEPPPKDECSICMQPMPYAVGLCGVGKTYMPCCGKMLCDGCVMSQR